MANLWCSDEEFQADVAAMQDAYEQSCKGRSVDPWRANQPMPTATAPGAHGNWAWNPAAVKCKTTDERKQPPVAAVVSRLWSI